MSHGTIALRREYSVKADGSKVLKQPSMETNGELQYDFIEEPSPDYYCPVSLDILHSPQLTDCCGHHLSLHIAERLHKENLPCPVCKTEKLVTHKDKFFERKVKDLKVRCPFKNRGCTWTGELRDWDTHRGSCPKRPWACPDCNEVMCFEAGGEKHLLDCVGQRIACPNNCGIAYINKCDKDKHLEECPLQEVACSFMDSGCNVRVQRKEMKKHLEENMQRHMMAITIQSYEAIKILHQKIDGASPTVAAMMGRVDKRVMASKEKELTEKSILLSQKDDEIRRLQSELRVVRESLEKLPPVQSQMWYLKELHRELQAVLKFSCASYYEFTLKAYSQCKSKSTDGNWNGPAFYHPYEGYNMELSIDTNGFEAGAGTHLSAYINPNRGSFDSNLQWPVVCKVYLVLMNQRGDFGHHGKSAVLEWKKDCVDYQTITNTFVPFEKLSYDPIRNTQYLKNDCLWFRLYLDVKPKQVFRKK